MGVHGLSLKTVIIVKVEMSARRKQPGIRFIGVVRSGRSELDRCSPGPIASQAAGPVDRGLVTILILGGAFLVGTPNAEILNFDRRDKMPRFRLIVVVSLLLAVNAVLAGALAGYFEKTGQCEEIFPGNCICVSPVTERNCDLGESESCDWSPICNPG
jgi:hypothetical protein